MHLFPAPQYFLEPPLTAITAVGPLGCESLKWLSSRIACLYLAPSNLQAAVRAEKNHACSTITVHWILSIVWNKNIK